MCKMVQINCLIKEKEFLALKSLIEEALNKSETKEDEELYWTLLDMIEVEK